MRGLAGKVAVVAGGGSGIGAATARRLAAEGAAVVGDLNGDNAELVATEVRTGGGRALAAQFDISVDEEVSALVGVALAEFGGLRPHARERRRPVAREHRT